MKEENVKEVISYYSGCWKYVLEVFHKYDSLSDTVFLEPRELFIQHYPNLSETKKYVVYFDVDVSDWLVKEKNLILILDGRTLYFKWSKNKNDDFTTFRQYIDLITYYHVLKCTIKIMTIVNLLFV